MRKGDRKTQELEGQGVCWGIVSPCDIRVSPTWLPKCEQNKDDSNEHPKWGGKAHEYSVVQEL